MRTRDIKRELRRSREELPLTESQREDAIQKIAECKVPMRTRASFGEFVKEQVCFINKMVFVWHILWLALFVAAVAKGDFKLFGGTDLCLLSMAPPLLSLCTVNELAKIYCRGLLEIELTTKYSLAKAVMMRLFLLSLCTGIVLLVACVPAKYIMGIRYGRVLVYTLTPMLCMSGCLLCLMEKLQGQKLLYAAFALYIGLAAAAIFGDGFIRQIYAAEMFGAWLSVFLLALAGNLLFTYRLSKRLLQYELVMGK